MKTERAYAKINLFLDVVGRRENGYHDIVSIMQTVSLCDLVTLTWKPAEQTGITLSAKGNHAMPTDRRNLAWRAAERFLEAADLCGEVQITIEKQIPMAAGLAGGSADAAAVLRALNDLCCSPLSLEKLCDVGARLGADIPFCIMGGAALVTGIGDMLERIAPLPPCNLVVACMGEGVSTPWAYGRLDEMHDSFAHTTADSSRAVALQARLQNEGSVASCVDFYNIFEEVVSETHPAVDRIKAEMLKFGVVRAMMSGSGPSVFGVFEEEASAERACASLRALGAAAYVCKPMS